MAIAAPARTAPRTSRATTSSTAATYHQPRDRQSSNALPAASYDSPASSDTTRPGDSTAIAIGAVAIDSALLGLVAPLLPEIQARTGAGDEAVGLALAAYAVPIALFSLPLGRAADAVGRRKLLVAGLALVAAGSVLVAVTHSVGALMAARGVQGLGSAASWISALALVSDSAPPGGRGQAAREGAGRHRHRLHRRARARRRHGRPALVRGAVPDRRRLRARPARGRADRAAARGGPPALDDAGVRDDPGACRSGAGAWAAAMIVITSFVLGLIEVVAPLDLDARLGLSASVIGLLFAASIAVDAVFAPFGGRWGDREGRAYPAFVGLLGTALSAVLLAVLPGVLGTIVALVVYGAGLQPRDLGGRPVAGRGLRRAMSAAWHTASRTCSTPAGTRSARWSAARCSASAAPTSPTR